jgi:hypothetical protein
MNALLWIGIGLACIYLFIRSVQAYGNAARKRNERYIQSLIDENRFPTFTPYEQALFLIGQDNGLVLKKIGTRSLEGHHFKRVVSISKANFIKVLNEPEMFDRLKLRNLHDGIWISKWEGEFEIVTQDRGKVQPYKAFVDKAGALSFLGNMYYDELIRVEIRKIWEP